MIEEVRIKIHSVRFEVEASLFADETDGEEFVADREAEPETVEINTVGKLRREDGRIEVSYEETEVTGMEGSTTSVTFLEGQEGIVSMVREGAVSCVLVFEAGQRHHCVYNTPFMPFQVCVHTLTVENRLIDEKYISLDYIVEIRGAKAERPKFRIDIL